MSENVSNSIEFEIEKSKLKNLYGFLNALSDEVKMVFTKNGASVKIVDPAHISMVDTKINPNTFNFYVYRGKLNEIEVGMDLGKISNLLKLDFDNARFEYNYKDSCIFAYVGHICYKMGAVDTTGMTDPSYPKLDSPNEFTISVVEMDSIYKMINYKKVKDCVEFILTNDGIEFLSYYEDDPQNYKISKELLESYTFRGNKKEVCRYSKDYLASYLKVLKKSKSKFVTIKMSEDFPLEAHLDFDGYIVSYFLAPRVENPDYSESQVEPEPMPEPEPEPTIPEPIPEIPEDMDFDKGAIPGELAEVKDGEPIIMEDEIIEPEPEIIEVSKPEIAKEIKVKSKPKPKSDPKPKKVKKPKPVHKPKTSPKPKTKPKTPPKTTKRDDPDNEFKRAGRNYKWPRHGSYGRFKPKYEESHWCYQ